MKEFALYTAARLGLFVLGYVVVAGTYLLVTGGDRLPLLWPLVVAFLLSALASATLLAGMRERFAERVQQRANRMVQAQRFEDDAQT